MSKCVYANIPYTSLDPSYPQIYQVPRVIKSLKVKISFLSAKLEEMFAPKEI